MRRNERAALKNEPHHSARRAMTRICYLLLLGLFAIAVGACGEASSRVAGAQEADRSHVLVADKQGDMLYFVDAQTFAVEDSVAVGRGPHEVAAVPALRRAYVANYEGGTISVIDLDTRTEERRIELDPYSRPHGIMGSPDGTSVYVTVEANQAVIEMDAATGEILRSLKTGQEVTHMLAVGPDEERLYTTNLGSGNVTVIDLAEETVVTHIPTGEGTEGIALTPDGSELWITNRAEDTVSIIDTETLEVTTTFDVEGFPIRAYMTPNGSRAVVSSARAGGVTIFDVEQREQLARLETGAAPIGVQITPDGSHAFVGNSRDGTVSVIDLEALNVVDQIALGEGPDGMAFAPVPTN